MLIENYLIMFKESAKRILMIGLGVLILFYFIEWVTPKFSLANSLRNSALIVFHWPINFLSKIYIGATNLSDIFEVSQFKKENFNLREINLRLEEENEKLKEKELIFNKYAELIDLLPTLETVPAESRGYFEEGGRSYFIINKGTNDGVILGKGVVWGKFLVGKINEVYPKTAVVETILSKNSIINIGISSNRESGRGVAKGAVGIGLEVDGFPNNITVKEGEIVLTSGLGGVLPPNLIVGKVIKKISSKSEASQKFLVEILLDFKSLEFMQVIKN